MRKEVRELFERYKKEAEKRDKGRAAKVTYAEIKKIATKEELIEILEEIHNL